MIFGKIKETIFKTNDDGILEGFYLVKDELTNSDITCIVKNEKMVDDIEMILNNYNGCFSFVGQMLDFSDELWDRLPEDIQWQEEWENSDNILIVDEWNIANELEELFIF